MSPDTWARRCVALLMLVGTLIRLPQLSHSLNEMHGFRQAQTAYVVREYAAHGIDLRHTPLPIFGPRSDVPLELPLPQALAALIARLGVAPEAAMRVVGLVGFQCAALFLFLLAVRWHGRRVALIGLVLFEFLPFGLAWGAASLIEFPAAAAGLGMVVALERWWRGGSAWWLAVAGVAAVLLGAVKATTAPGYLVLAGFAAIGCVVERGRGGAGRALSGLLVSGAAGLVAALTWTSYADSVKAREPLVRFLLSKNLTAWNFGTGEQRRDPVTYARILTRVGEEIAAPLGLLLLLGAVFALLCSRGRADLVRRGGWTAAAVTSPLICLNLYFVHNYYLCAVFPLLAMVVALGVDAVVQAVAPLLRHRPIGKAALGALLATGVVVACCATTLGRIDVHQWGHDGGVPPSAQAIRAATRPTDRIVTVGCDWDPLMPYYVHRSVLMLRPDEEAAAWAEVGGLAGYSYVYRCDPSADPLHYLPTGIALTPSDVDGLWRVDGA
ncbi:hypothetical protein [Nocardioides sp. CER19]|uniref:ArnT family glycosyltransferase n=1 Tax=Nocardioides sp. CER19 TaxID=3038538 RepID=UPI00244D31F0|nr:hypothetical protein [Nocardioides sp. CER19]MDH2413599.1 hypothetical protein [Nocardioides sp. CER19]